GKGALNNVGVGLERTPRVVAHRAAGNIDGRVQILVLEQVVGARCDVSDPREQVRSYLPLDRQIPVVNGGRLQLKMRCVPGVDSDRRWEDERCGGQAAEGARGW